jgi:hypothetical protein
VGRAKAVTKKRFRLLQILLPFHPATVFLFVCFCITLSTFPSLASQGKCLQRRSTSPPARWIGSTNAEAVTNTVKESMPAEYRKRYLRWRNEYLSTQAGREQWNLYALNPHFTLTITVSKDEGQGARVDGFRWDEAGKLIAATIILGNKLDSGYPSSINYPITCSLAPGNLPPEAKGTILAATKLAHEFGHLNRTMSMDGRLYRLQNQLMIEYNRFFYANGRDTNDPYLFQLAEQMGGTPVSIKQDRESWAEMGAILYLQERLRRDHRLKMPQQIRQAIEAYFVSYPGRML